LAIVGPNGAGKSTLLKILANEATPDSGDVRFNPAAKPAYFAQSAPEQLDPEATAVDAVLSGGLIKAEEARGLLGRMRITGEMADRPVRSFSGGERRRIMLARLMARKADILLLDEPTNDLDIESRDALESVLDEYAGAVVIVSHDRYLLNRLSDRVLWIENGAWGLIEGGYDAYERYSNELESRASTRKKASRGDTRLTPLKQRSQLATKVARIERDIEKADARKAEIDALFEQPELYEDRARVKSLQAERDELSRTSAAHLMRWEEAAAELERLQAEDLTVS
jgi:ATP-binding cassette subfamily F protein 3